MRLFLHVAAAALAFGALACSPPQGKGGKGGTDGTDATATAEAGCPAGVLLLSRTGLCPTNAAAAFPAGRLTATSEGLPEGCTWVVNETTTPDENEAILYNALSCNGRTTQLEFSAGARSASLGWGVSGFFENAAGNGEIGQDLVRLFLLEGVADPQAMILNMAKQTTTNKREAAACVVRPAGEGFPADAFVVDVTESYQRANRIGRFETGDRDDPGFGVYAACGQYGFTDARAFWLIRDGYAWFVNQGQDLPDFDAGSLTVVRKGPDGVWRHTP